MGRDKATLRLGPGGRPLAAHLGALLAAVTSPALEIGPGVSGLSVPPVADPGTGPLGAIAAGAAALAELGHLGPAVVLATDLPRLSGELLGRIAGFERGTDRFVVPVASGRLQPLCARWPRRALERAAELARGGERRVGAVLEESDLVLVGPGELAYPAAEDELADVDTPDELWALGFDPGSPGAPHSP